MDSPDILSGGDATDPGAIPMGAPTVAPPDAQQAPPPAAPPQPAIQPSPALTGQPASVPTPAPPVPAGQPSVWKSLVMGALTGLSAGSQVHSRGVGGAIAGGLGAGVGAELNRQQVVKQQATAAQQQQLENANKAQQLQFQSVEAANNAVRTNLAVKESQRQDEESKVAMDKHAVDVNNAAMAGGQDPPFILNTRTGHYAIGDGGDQGTPHPTSLDAQAMSTLDVASKANDGKVPIHAAVISPHSDASPGVQVQIYTTTPAQVKSNPNAAESIINEAARYNSPDAPPMTHAEILQQGAKANPANPLAGVAEMATRAKQDLFASASPTGDAAKDEAASATFHTMADRYEKAAQTDSQKSYAKALQSRADAFDASMKSAQKGTQKVEASSAGAKTGSEEQAKLSVQNNPANVQAEANRKAAEATATTTAKNAATPQSEWKPKVGADEKKKAELAENIAENANAVNQILAKRPDLIGAVAGRATSTEQLIGNNDPDISALGTRIHNIAMANSGVHGFRSQEGVQQTEKQLLNGFKNGPQAVAGALKATTDSTQTFIDNARPEGYQTHSSKGGAYGYYQKAQPGQKPVATAPSPQTPHNVIVGGKVVGTTIDGKTMQPVAGAQ